MREQELLEEKLRRLAHLYRDMVIDDDEYSATRDSLQRRLAMLAIPDTQEIIEAVDYLRNLKRLWEAATSVEKQSLSRVLLQMIAVDVVNEAIVGVFPQRPFGVLLRDVCGETIVLEATG